MGSFYVKTKKGGPAQGPFTAEQLRTLAAKGKLRPHYLVSRDARTWYIAKNVKDLPTARSAPAAARPAGRSPVAALAAAAEAHRTDAPTGGRRLPVGPILGLLAAAAVTAVVAHVLLNCREPDLSGNASTAGPGKSAGGEAAVAPGPPAKPAPTAAAPRPAAPRRPGKAAPVPKPRKKREPAKPAGSFQVLSVAFGGQVVQAMGSELTFNLTNRGDKGIRSVKGGIRLYDPEGNYLISLPAEVEEPIAPGATAAVSNVWMNVGGRIYGLLDRASKQMTFRFAADRVVYEDGQAQTFE